MPRELVWRLQIPRNGTLVDGRGDLPAVLQLADVCIQSTPATNLPACSVPASWQGTEMFKNPAGLLKDFLN